MERQSSSARLLELLASSGWRLELCLWKLLSLSSSSADWICLKPRDAYTKTVTTAPIVEDIRHLTELIHAFLPMIVSPTERK